MKLDDKRYYYYYYYCQDIKRKKDVGKQDLFMYKREDYTLWTLFRKINGENNVN